MTFEAIQEPTRDQQWVLFSGSLFLGTALVAILGAIGGAL